mmetsp:Transcript_1362/g.2009  ORF Transcript_1362/g.2009 Transcript_1362/m.2009 type:complete len:268 (-) Transcript_1362:10307-11110(-)
MSYLSDVTGITLITGNRQRNSLGLESFTMPALVSQRAPSRERPWIYAPSDEYSVISEAPSLDTSVMNCMTSSGNWLARAYTCCTAVTNALALKSPGSHTVLGCSILPDVHFSSCVWRSLTSRNQRCRENTSCTRVDICFIQLGGTELRKIPFCTSSMAGDMLSAPSRPRVSSSSERLRNTSRSAMRIASCSAHTTYGFLSVMRLSMSMTLKGSGQESIMDSTPRRTTLSMLSPPPTPPPPPLMSPMVLKRISPSVVSNDSCALKCRP